MPMSNIELPAVPVSERILYEDNHLIAINKLPGELAQPDETGEDDLSVAVKAYIKEAYQKPGDVFLGIIHRLDRPVTGVMLFAKTSKALARMNTMFSSREVQKTYHALVRGVPTPEAGTLVHHLVKHQATNNTRAFNKPVMHSKLAELDYRTLEVYGETALMEVMPKTGRSHQIRVQLAAIGCPIRGDIRYGPKPPNADRSICLHAAALAFQHPVTKVEVHITAPHPNADIWEQRSRM